MNAEYLLQKIAIFVATRWELNAIRHAFVSDHMTTLKGFRCLFTKIHGHHIHLVQTGIGMEKAAEASRMLFSEGRLDLVIASGFAGALAPSSVGAFVVPDEIVSYIDDGTYDISSTITCNQKFRKIALDIAQLVSCDVLAGRLITVPRIMWLATQKKLLADQLRAMALDMESISVGKMAIEHGTPFIVIRTTSDLVWENLPLDFNLFCHPSTWIKGAWKVFTHPTKLAQLNRLRKQMNIASKQLTNFFERFFIFMKDYA